MTPKELIELIRLDSGCEYGKEMVAEYADVAKENGLLIMAMNGKTYFFSGIIQCLVARDKSKMLETVYLNMEIKQASKSYSKVYANLDMTVLQRIQGSVSFHLENECRESHCAYLKDEFGDMYLGVFRIDSKEETNNTKTVS